MPVNVEEFDAVTKQILKDYGTGVVHSGRGGDKVWRIPTGSHELDWAVGGDPIGGIPMGRWSRFYGGPMSGKSMTCWNIIKNAQNLHIIYEDRLATLAHFAEKAGDKALAKHYNDELKRFLERFPNGLKCAYYNIEKQYHEDFVEKQGVNIDDLVVFEGTIIEQVGDILENSLGSIHLHVLDSCSSAVPNEELDMGPFEQRRGLAPRTWGKMFRRAMERFDPNENTIILVDQVRVNLMTGAEEAPGGKMMEHTSSLSLQFRRDKWLYRKNGVLTEDAQKIDSLSGQKEPEGIEIVARVNKSRVGRPFRTCRMRLGFDDMRFDTTYELIKAAKHYGIARTSGAWYYHGDESFHGQGKFREYLQENPELQQEIIEKLMEER